MLTLSFNGDPLAGDALDNFAFQVHFRFRRANAVATPGGCKSRAELGMLGENTDGNRRQERHGGTERPLQEGQNAAGCGESTMPSSAFVACSMESPCNDLEQSITTARLSGRGGCRPGKDG